jgi:hypothetical protein
MELIIGILIGLFVRHVLWYSDRRQALVNMFKGKNNEHQDN